MVKFIRFLAKKKDGERSKGKGRHVCLGDRVFSNPCRASCFVSVDMKEKLEFILFFQIDLGKKLYAARNRTNSVPQTEATTFAFASGSILLP